MVQCYDCGAPCGKNHPTGWRNEHFWCDKCWRNHGKTQVAAILFVLFAVISTVVTFVYTTLVLNPIAAIVGYATVKGIAIGTGVGGIILYFMLKKVAGNIDGCLTRMLVKMISYFALALAVGVLVIVFAAEGEFKDCVGCEQKSETTVEQPATVEQQPTSPSRE